MLHKLFYLKSLALAFLLASGMSASAVTTSLIAFSETNREGNTADTFGADYGAFTPEGASWSLDGVAADAPVTIGSVRNTYLSPFAFTALEQTRSYFSVAGFDDNGGGPDGLMLTFAEAIDSLSILVGSFGNSNSFTFFDENEAEIASLTGEDIMEEVGGISPAGVALLNFDAGVGPLIASIRFNNPAPALEFALLGPTAVPVPAAGGLALLGLGALAALRRRRTPAT